MAQSRPKVGLRLLARDKAAPVREMHVHIPIKFSPELHLPLFMRMRYDERRLQEGHS